MVGALLGLAIGSGKGRSGEGFFLGLLFGLIGCLIVAVMQPTPEAEAERMSLVNNVVNAQAGGSLQGAESGSRPCPWCAETIKSAAIVCRFCGRDVVPLPESAMPASPSPSDYESVRIAHPASFDQVWDVAIGISPWPPTPSKALSAACRDVDLGVSASDATRRAFHRFQNI